MLDAHFNIRVRLNIKSSTKRACFVLSRATRETSRESCLTFQSITLMKNLIKNEEEHENILRNKLVNHDKENKTNSLPWEEQ